MITKTVSNGQRSATATISEETKFIFSDAWDYFHAQNLGSGIVYISMSQGAAAGNDGVIAIPAGGTACTSHGFSANTVYVTANNTTDVVQIIGSSSAISPFKSATGGGGTGETYTTLYNGSLDAYSTATLADNISSYKKIEILTEVNNSAVRGYASRDISVYPAADIMAVNKVYLFDGSPNSNNLIMFPAQNQVTNWSVSLSLLRIRGIN